MTQERYQPTLDAELDAEATQWESGGTDPSGWIDAPEAIPRVRASTPISLRLPTQMLRILKLFAEREGVGYQVLMKQWLDERIREERDKLAERLSSGETVHEGLRVSELLAARNWR
ncbi:MAG: hypothetical protein J4N31_04290 [Chloroflexi bacterium]|nr:hypothetical protein [Chloroflexota bacterium]